MFGCLVLDKKVIVVNLYVFTLGLLYYNMSKNDWSISFSIHGPSLQSGSFLLLFAFNLHQKLQISCFGFRHWRWKVRILRSFLLLYSLGVGTFLWWRFAVFLRGSLSTDILNPSSLQHSISPRLFYLTASLYTLDYLYIYWHITCFVTPFLIDSESFIY